MIEFFVLAHAFPSYVEKIKSSLFDGLLRCQMPIAFVAITAGLMPALFTETSGGSSLANSENL
jgi:hypothetical protein